MQRLIPAIIPNTLADVVRVAEIMGHFSEELHIDVVDGVFVPNISWPYGTGAMKGEPRDSATITERFKVEVDLMIHDALRELPAWITAGVARAVVHIESCFDVEEAKKICSEKGVLLGVAANNDTPLDVLLSELQFADYVQCMGIAHIGVQGEPFDERALERIQKIKSAFPGLLISIDGSVNKETIARLHEAGAERFIAGSAILHSRNPEVAYQELFALVHK